MKASYQVVCLVCYTCVIATCTSKRDADRAAVGHMNAYGHDVTIQTKGGK
jgi:hypothetical protein